ncbi:MAG: hypothetical protein COB66_03440 [Coxiella sp. (in: Bacteria)]|nr:MAG: hypothetical protein COB66_03440 [Coxiella sp. (in: g-proteobacteria)]
MKSILLMCLLMLQSGFVLAVQSIEGFPSIPFGASLAEVKQQVITANLTHISEDQQEGFNLVHANQAGYQGGSSLVFVVNQKTDKLGLVIQRFDALLTDRMIIKNFTKHYGEPMDETATKLIYGQIKADLPEGLQRITVWADHSSDAKASVSRFIRVLYFGSYVSIEYLDAGIM